MSRISNKIGAAGEALAVSCLRAIGVQQIEKIGTPVTVIRSPRTGKITGAFYGEPVAADFRGVMPHYGIKYSIDETIGQSVMAEVKTVEHNLRWSDFQPHQPGKLTEHADLGGLSLIAWVHSSGVYILRWPIPDFAAGRSVDIVTASRLNMIAYGR